MNQSKTTQRVKEVIEKKKKKKTMKHVWTIEEERKSLSTEKKNSLGDRSTWGLVQAFLHV